MKNKVAVSLLTVTAIASSFGSQAFAETSASVFGVAQYDNEPNLNNDDATTFRNKLGVRAWSFDVEHYDANVVPSDFTLSGRKSDVVFFTGHGSTNGSLILKTYAGSNTPYDGYVNWDTIGNYWAGWDTQPDETDDFEFGIFMACDVLQRNSWGKVLANGGHHILGYEGVSSESLDQGVIASFVERATGDNGTTPLKLITAWQNANVAFGEPNWSITGHKGNENDYFHGAKTTGPTADISGTSDIYSWFSGGGFYVAVPKGTTEAPLIGEAQALEKFKVKKENLDINKLTKTLLKQDLKVLKGKQLNADSYTDGISNFYVYPSGAVNYERERVYTPITFTQADAIKQANNFILENGGMPSDAYLAEIFPQKSIHNDTEETTGYLITYKHNYNNVKIDGDAGDSIKVIVDNSGISFYLRLWREVSSEVKNSSKKSISGTDALKIGKEEIRKKLKTVETPTIQNVELVYWSQPFTSEQTDLVPAWKISTNTHSVYVNADTSEILDSEEVIKQAIN